MTSQRISTRGWLMMAMVALPAELLATSACAGGQYPLGVETDEGFTHATYDYGIGYLPGTRSLLSDDWRLDNYVQEADGSTRPKTTNAYTTLVTLDHDGDGRFDARVRIPIYDLLYEHRRHDGTIFVSTLPQSQHARERELGIILRDFVESAAHNGRIQHDFRIGTSYTSSAMASRILVSRPVTVDGMPAHEVIFEVANVQQLELTPDARWQRGHVVVVRPDFAFTQDQYRRDSPLGSQAAFYPTLLVMGYANHPDEFDETHQDFIDLVRRARIGRTVDFTSLRPRIEACSPRLGAVDMLFDTGGDIAAWSLRSEDEGYACVTRLLSRVHVAPSEWPRTYSVPVTPPRTADGRTTVSAELPASEAPTPAAPPTAPPTTPEAPTAGGETPFQASPAAPDAGAPGVP